MADSERERVEETVSDYEQRRYEVVCVAPDVPSRGRYDDLDEAIANTDAHFEVYDREMRTYVGPTCREEYDEAIERLRRKRAALPHGGGGEAS